jgi:hypothetical protein
MALHHSGAAAKGKTTLPSPRRERGTRPPQDPDESAVPSSSVRRARHSPRENFDGLVVIFAHPEAKTRRNWAENCGNLDVAHGREKEKSHKHFTAIQSFAKNTKLIVFPACIHG